MVKYLHLNVGFACFFFFIAFWFMVAIAVYISPLACGSNNEKKMIRSPQELEEGYKAYEDTTERTAVNTDIYNNPSALNKAI